VRNIGSSIGISVVITYLAQRSQMNHEAFAAYITPFNVNLHQGGGMAELMTPKGLAMINGEVTRQASLLAYLQDFRLMMWVSLCAVPLVVLLRAPGRSGSREEMAILE
jgi:DHA2 family multidrug resistance protein